QPERSQDCLALDAEFVSDLLLILDGVGRVNVDGAGRGEQAANGCGEGAAGLDGDRGTDSRDALGPLDLLVVISERQTEAIGEGALGGRGGRLGAASGPPSFVALHEAPSGVLTNGATRI